MREVSYSEEVGARREIVVRVGRERGVSVGRERDDRVGREWGEIVGREELGERGD